MPHIIDLHCDLLSYLQKVPTASPFTRTDIGCSLPFLQEGNVKLQVMAIYTATDKRSTALAVGQSELFRNMLQEQAHQLHLVTDVGSLDGIELTEKTGVLAAIENASGICDEDEPLAEGFKRLERIIDNTGRVLYIGLTHHEENRFGGGNTTTIGLKNDGRKLLDYLSGRKIAIDFAHTSDALAYDLLHHISKYNLDIPVIASHSNYRKVWNHARNLPDDIALEIINKNGLIGLNFLRAFVNNDDPTALLEHLLYGINLGGKDAVCFGADFFYTGSHPDQSRVPFFFKEHESAARYPSIVNDMSALVSQDLIGKVSHENAENFIRRIWQ